MELDGQIVYWYMCMVMSMGTGDMIRLEWKQDWDR